MTPSNVISNDSDAKFVHIEDLCFMILCYYNPLPLPIELTFILERRSFDGKFLYNFLFIYFRLKLISLEFPFSILWLCVIEYVFLLLLSDSTVIYVPNYFDLSLNP